MANYTYSWDEVTVDDVGQPLLTPVSAYEVYVDGNLFGSTSNLTLLVTGLSAGAHLIQSKAINPTSPSLLSSGVTVQVPSDVPAAPQGETVVLA
jgi:hypothetical protein